MGRRFTGFLKISLKYLNFKIHFKLKDIGRGRKHSRSGVDIRRRQVCGDNWATRQWGQIYNAIIRFFFECKKQILTFIINHRKAYTLLTCRESGTHQLGGPIRQRTTGQSAKGHSGRDPSEWQVTWELENVAPEPELDHVDEFIGPERLVERCLLGANTTWSDQSHA